VLYSASIVDVDKLRHFLVRGTRLQIEAALSYGWSSFDDTFQKPSMDKASQEAAAAKNGSQ
jgi:hypothetical protein